MVAGEISALMTALEMLFARASPDGAKRGEWERFFGPATVTGHLLRLCPEDRGQFFFKFLIIVAIRRPDRATLQYIPQGDRYSFLIFIKYSPSIWTNYLFC